MLIASSILAARVKLTLIRIPLLYRAVIAIAEKGHLFAHATSLPLLKTLTV